MKNAIEVCLGLCLTLLWAASGSALLAGPTNVTITPPGGARFLFAQRFDIRVEGKGTGPFSATLAIDGVARTFTSGDQGTTTTDHLTSDGWGGFNLRGYSNRSAGSHIITASFTDSTGTVQASSTFTIIDPFPQSGSEKRPAKNIIILLGDGMGAAHRTAARLVKYGVTGGSPNDYLAMDKFPGTGMIVTHSLNSIITDSAPGMACYASGSHAFNGQEGVYPAHMTNPFFYPRVEYLSEYMHRFRSKSLGLVTTADVEDATPAANVVHTGNRNAGTGICDQYLDESSNDNPYARSGSGLAVLMGGGRRWFLPATDFGSSRTSSTDYPAIPIDLQAGWDLRRNEGAIDPNRNLLRDFQNAGFAYVDTLTALKSVGTPDRLLGLFAYGNMNVALDKIAKRRGKLLPGSTTFAVDDYHAPDQPMLDEMTDTALKVLSQNAGGFVLMVEGAHIDKQSHMMDADRAIGETIEFDNAVDVCRKFAEAQGDTIVIVLADHECSGFSLIGALTGGMSNLVKLAPDNANTDPKVAPQRQNTVGTYDLAGFPQYSILADGYPDTFDIDNKILVGYGANGDRYETWLTRPLPVIDSLLSTNIQGELASKGYAGQPYQTSDSQSGFFIRGQAVGQAQAVHTASDIPISAASPGTTAYQLFVGVQENTDVFFKLVRIAFGAY